MRRMTTTIGLVAFASLLVGAYDEDGCACSPVEIENPSASASSSGGLGGFGGESTSSTTGTGGAGGVGGSGGVPTCGNHTLDTSINEPCDDGNSDPNDGCDKCKKAICYDCPVADMLCTLTPAAASVECGMGGNGPMYCNGSGMCVNHCMDGQTNGGEVLPDCGGGGCASCNGDACSVPTDCASGFCADGVCCNTACTPMCFRCDLLSNTGKCLPTPLGIDDKDTCTSNVNTTCDGAGQCTDYMALKQIGEGCTLATECVGNLTDGVQCENPGGGGGGKICGLPKDAPCDLNEQCIHGVCSGMPLTCN